MGSATRHYANALESVEQEYRCYGCDSERAVGYTYCPSCDEPTESYQWDGVDPFAVAREILAS